MFHEETRRWLQTLDVKGRNHEAARRGDTYFIDRYCAKCGKSLSKDRGCLIAAEGRKERKEAITTEFLCDQCYREQFVQEICIDCDGYTSENILRRVIKWLRRQIFRTYYCSEDILEDCICESNDSGSFVCSCPV